MNTKLAAPAGQVWDEEWKALCIKHNEALAAAKKAEAEYQRVREAMKQHLQDPRKPKEG